MSHPLSLKKIKKMKMKKWEEIKNNNEEEVYRLEISSSLMIYISKYKSSNVTPKGWFCEVPVSLSFGIKSNIILNYDLTATEVKERIIECYINTMAKEIEYIQQNIEDATLYLGNIQN